MRCGAGVMDVKHLCLGVLCVGDSSGYDIKKYFESSFRHFFVAGYGSIYPALSSLLKQGLVSVKTQHQERLPDKKIYEVTAAGRAAFEEALASTVPRHKLRSEFLTLMHFAHLLPASQVEGALQLHLSELQALRENLLQANRQSTAAPYGEQFSRDYALLSTEALIDFVQRFLQQLPEKTANT